MAPNPATADVLPTSFKAAKRRKTPQYIREEERTLSLTTPSPQPLVSRSQSEVSVGLLENPDSDKVTAGVARLIFRYIAEGRPRSLRSRSSSGSDCGAIVPQLAGPGAKDFDEEVYFWSFKSRWMNCRWRRCCWFLPKDEDTDLVGSIFKLLQACMLAGHFSQELVVVATVYIERFLEHSSVRLTSTNWQPIMLAGLLLASKVWEDIHPWNVDFAAILRKVGLRPKDRLSIYRLESEFLRGLKWQACISGEVYAAYLFSLKDADLPPSPGRWAHCGDAVPRRAFSWSASSWRCGGLLMGIPETVEEVDCTSQHSATSFDSSSCASGEPRLAHFQRLPLVLGRDAAKSASIPREERLSMEDMMWADPRNPLIGTFRHAPHAGPPSRHINPRLPPPQVKPHLKEQRAEHLPIICAGASAEFDRSCSA